MMTTRSQVTDMHYILRSPDGKYLNSTYHGRWKRGCWRDSRQDARLYRSKVGIRNALYGTAFPVLKEHVGMSDYTAPTSRWTDEDRAARLKLFAAIAAIPSDVWWQLMQSAGYELEEISI